MDMGFIKNILDGLNASKEMKNTSVKEYNINQLIELINLGKSNEEICTILNISYNTLYKGLLKLKNSGFQYQRKYYSDGSIKYEGIYNISDLKDNNIKKNSQTIITDPSENNIKMLLISDLHFGNELERLYLIDSCFDYCKKNGINIILCAGDFIDGSFSKETQNISDIEKQIKYFLKKYPQDNGILTFGVCGDHDASALKDKALDLIEICKNYRHDIIIPGYNNAFVHLKNDSIHLYHHLDSGKLLSSHSPIVLHGHSHKYSILSLNNKTNISVPSISAINQNLPVILELEVYFDKGYIMNYVVKHILLNNEPILLSETTFDLHQSREIRTTNENSIRNEENYKVKNKS